MFLELGQGRWADQVWSSALECERVQQSPVQLCRVQSSPVLQSPVQSSRVQEEDNGSEDEEEKDDDKENSQQNPNGTPLTAITGHVGHFGKLLHHVVQSGLGLVHLVAEVI